MGDVSKFKIGEYVKFSREKERVFLQGGGSYSYQWRKFAYGSLVDGNIFIVHSATDENWISVNPVIVGPSISSKNMRCFIIDYFWSTEWFESVSVLELACIKVKQKESGKWVSSK